MLINPVTAPRLNFATVLSLLKSKEWTKEQEDAFEETSKTYGSLYLDEACPVNKIAFASYVRSGNSLTRKFFEDITSIITGSNTDNRVLRSFSL